MIRGLVGTPNSLKYNNIKEEPIKEEPKAILITDGPKIKDRQEVINMSSEVSVDFSINLD